MQVKNITAPIPIIPETMMGIEFLWGGQVQLETIEIHVSKTNKGEIKRENKKVIYTIKNKKLSKRYLA